MKIPVKYTISISAIFLLAYADDKVIVGTVPDHTYETNNSLAVISEMQRNIVKEKMAEVEKTMNRDTLVLFDPISGGMVNINDGGTTSIMNYPDENRNNTQTTNYACESRRTFNNCTMTDILIGGFYHMDEMSSAVLAAADGVVTYTHDGEFDRWTSYDASAIHNMITLYHSGNVYTHYFRLKKNSILVVEDEFVEAGDTIAYVGNSGPMRHNQPNLGFEVTDFSGNYISPWGGQCGINQSMWFDQIPYMGDTTSNLRQTIRFVHSGFPLEIDPLDWNTWNYIVWENIPNTKHFNPGDSQMTLAVINNLLKTDTLKNHTYLGDNLVNEIIWIPGETESWWSGDDPSPYTPWFWYGTFPDYPDGNYRKELYINDSLVGINEFYVDNSPNQAPTVNTQFVGVQIGETVEGEFTANDNDGSVIWFNLESGPNHGTIEIFGGRDRKFRYTAPNDYVGSDAVSISATDDKNETGASSLVLFNIMGELDIHDEAVLASFSVDDAYPNPFNPSTQIVYNLPEATFVNIYIIDINGKSIKKLVSSYQDHGQKKVRWDASDDFGRKVSAGIYFYKITTEYSAVTKKIILLK